MSHQPHELPVALTDPVPGVGRGEPEGLLQGLHQVEGHVLFRAEPFVGQLQALRPGHHRRVEPREGKVALIDRLHDGLHRQAGGVPGREQANAADVGVAVGLGPLLPLERAELDQPPNVVGPHVGVVRQLVKGKRMHGLPIGSTPPGSPPSHSRDAGRR
jgi:hypothetical protein